MSERALATVQTVKELVPIAGADFIEIATFESIGWQCVVKKGEMAPGAKAVYFEIQSIVPDTPVFEFLGGHRRLRSKKFKGALSQGLALPLSSFPEVKEFWCKDGTDLTEFLGVELYEPPVSMSGGPNMRKGDFPVHLGVSKTDETRIQSIPAVLDELRGFPYYITLKCDGTSATYCVSDGEFTVCSRNMMLKDGDSVYWAMARKYGIAETLAKFPHLILQGEICGPGIQKNRLGLTDTQLFIFNVFDTKEQRYLDHNEFVQVCEGNGLTTVPIIAVGNAFDYSQAELLEKAKGKYPGTKNHREGIVVRPLTEMFSERLHGRLSFKVINNDFLLANEDE